jgi:hypothetical protein
MRFPARPFPQLFPVRNRIIRGLTLGTLVTKTGVQSGALTTVCYALEQAATSSPGQGRWSSPSIGLHALQAVIFDGAQPTNILDALADTLAWLDWSRPFGPISGFDDKLTDPLLSYLITTFCYDCQLAPPKLRGHCEPSIGAISAGLTSGTSRSRPWIRRSKSWCMASSSLRCRCSGIAETGGG